MGGEVEMNEYENADIVKCGSIIQSGNQYSSILEKLEKNCTKGIETITFSMSDWSQIKNVVRDVESKIDEMSQLTPVSQAHGVCRATVCQWSALSDKREQADSNERKINELYKMVEHSLRMVDNLVKTEVIAIEGWWIKDSGVIRAKLEEMKHI